MPRRDHLNSTQFKYLFHDDTDEHEIMAFGNDGQRGRLLWSDHDGEITHLHVGQNMRRSGIATAMWQTAHDEASDRGITAPEHSSQRTPEGDAWAQAVGGHVPDLDEEASGWSSE